MGGATTNPEKGSPEQPETRTTETTRHQITIECENADTIATLTNIAKAMGASVTVANARRR